MNWDIFARYLLLIEYGTRWWSKWLACQSIRITICSIGFWITIDRTDYYQLYIGLIVTSLSFIYSPSLEGGNCKTSFPTKVNTFIYPQASISLNALIWDSFTLFDGQSCSRADGYFRESLSRKFPQRSNPYLAFQPDLLSSSPLPGSEVETLTSEKGREEELQCISCLIYFR